MMKEVRTWLLLLQESFFRLSQAVNLLRINAAASRHEAKDSKYLQSVKLGACTNCPTDGKAMGPDSVDGKLS